MKSINSGKKLKQSFRRYSSFLIIFKIISIILTIFFIMLFSILFIFEKTDFAESIIWLYQVYVLILFLSSFGLFITNFFVELLFAVELGDIKIKPTILLSLIIIILIVSMRFDGIYSIILVIPIPFLIHFYFSLEIKSIIKITQNLK